MKEIYIANVATVQEIALFTLTIDGQPVLRRRPMDEIIERLSCETAAEIRREREAKP